MKIISSYLLAKLNCFNLNFVFENCFGELKEYIKKKNPILNINNISFWWQNIYFVKKTKKKQKQKTKYNIIWLKYLKKNDENSTGVIFILNFYISMEYFWRVQTKNDIHKILFNFLFTILDLYRCQRHPGAD